MHAHRLLCLVALTTACATTPAGPDVTRAAEGPTERCGRGLAADCRDLGRALLLGDGARRDDRLAAAYVLKACELGDSTACADLAVLSAVGRGVSQGDVRAVALSRRACEAGAGLACSNLGVLTMAGASAPAHRPEEAREDVARVVQLFRSACDAGVPEGCLNLGTALEVGEIAGRDAQAAARALRRSCDGGFALACHRLERLGAREPAVRLDGLVEALAARACDAAIAPACEAARRPLPPAGPRTPSPRLVAEPRSLALGIPGAGGFHPADLAAAAGGARRVREEVRRPTESLLAAVPPAARERLGLAGATRPGGEEDQPVELLVALRRHQFGSCYQAERKTHGVRTEAVVAFLVEADGRPGEVRAAATPSDAELEACAAEVVAGWEFPMPAGGLSGPHLARFTFEPAPFGAPPQLVPPGGLRPAMKQPGCVERKLKVPPAFRGAAGGATVKFAVDGSGAPVLLHAITAAPEAIVQAIVEAVRACEWAPGADAAGRSATLWLTLPVRFDGR